MSAKKKGGKRTPSRARAAKAAPIALLAGALRAQSEGVFIAERKCGPQGMKIVFANDSFCAMTGYSSIELVNRAHGFLHVERVDVERLRHWLPKAQPGQPLVGEGYLLRADHSSISAAWSFDPLCDTRGRITHIVATYRDQTEKRRLQEALVHAQRLDAVGRLAGGVAHDFNNLLSVINGYCEMLAAHVAANPQAMREVAEIHHAGRKAAALTSQLLAFSRRQPLNSRVINLNELVTSNAEIMRRLLGDAGQIDLELAPDLLNVRTDPAQFQQVILNLVLNARDALRDRGRIVITTAVRDVRSGLNRRQTDTPPGRYVSITVADNGTGMDADTQKHLFEPFFTTKPEGKGTGLGLALVYGVVQQSGGFISVRSALLVGSTFEILLPLWLRPWRKRRQPSRRCRRRAGPRPCCSSRMTMSCARWSRASSRRTAIAWSRRRLPARRCRICATSRARCNCSSATSSVTGKNSRSDSTRSTRSFASSAPAARTAVYPRGWRRNKRCASTNPTP